ncbi:hypothetical protein Tcan_13163 [Toxocara canis]|uniref:Uncharacterized protein n=2 Tax=Toxocara canis TaxID=6265 RepID=A0A0B2VYB4_TOXCA|nr:hypothetical protein Tcan_13163 [Toxocara canis]VDM44358.1 unnamed protein product [Toxocara canis]
MAGFGQQPWSSNPSMDQQWGAHQQQFGPSQWSGWNPNMNSFGVQQGLNNSTMPMGYPNDMWSGQNQMGINQWNNQGNQWGQTGHWGNMAPTMNQGAWASQQENQWTHQHADLAGPAGFGGTTPSAVASTATAKPASSGSNLVLGNGTSGNLWEHANWPSSSYQLDAPQYAGMGR